MDFILTTSPWREAFWLALGAVAFGLLAVAFWLGRDALRPRRAARSPALSSTPSVPPLPSAPDRTDALEEIDGVGRRAAQVLREHGIFTFEQLSALRPAQLRFILLRYEDFRFVDPSTWPFQARLLAERRWTDFRRLTAALDNGMVRLRDVRGIGDCHLHVLEDGGIRTVGDLQRSTPELIAELFPSRERGHIVEVAAGWIDEARRLHEGDEQALSELAGIEWDGRKGGSASGYGAYEGRRFQRGPDRSYGIGWWGGRGAWRERDERYEAYRGRGSDLVGIPLVLLALLLLLLLIFGIGGCVATMTTLSRVDSLLTSRAIDVTIRDGDGVAIDGATGRDGRDGRDAVDGRDGRFGGDGRDGRDGGDSGGGQGTVSRYGPHNCWPTPYPIPYPIPACPQAPSCPSGGSSSGCVPTPSPAPPPPPRPRPEPPAPPRDDDGAICECSVDGY